MKYHKKARKFCEEKIFKMDGMKEQLWDTVKNKIESADSEKLSLEQAMEKFGKDYGDKPPEEAIGILEVLFEFLASYDTRKYLYESENFQSEWKRTDRRLLFDIVFDSMQRTAVEKNNEDLLNYLSTYTKPIVNHNKAQELYKSHDSDGDYCSSIVEDIEEFSQNHKSPLKEMVRYLGSGLIHEEPEIAIVTLEGLYEALSEKWDFIVGKGLNRCENGNQTYSLDELFSFAIYALDETANNRPIPFKDHLNALEEFYPEQ